MVVLTNDNLYDIIKPKGERMIKHIIGAIMILIGLIMYINTNLFIVSSIMFSIGVIFILSNYGNR